MSKDPNLLRAFTAPSDFFTALAAELFEISHSEVREDTRKKAKGVAYGVLYGMGTQTLATNLDIDEKAAEDLIKSFGSKYPTVAEFRSKTIELCMEQGYVTTILNRRRYLPKINAKNIAARLQAQRQAFNSCIQGSAADIVKKCIVRVIQEFTHLFHSAKDSPRLVLQIHDELLMEVPSYQIEEIAALVRRIMCESVELEAPLQVKMRAGSDWGSLKELKHL